ncbi:MAG: STAS domain-containing protein [Anaerolineales bacterium]|nr:STAS domain-containing protein [Anaerolineales bacterium]NUQ83094.1 STAS domain-containing protein [Anaerolineales bacterium]
MNIIVSQAQGSVPVTVIKLDGQLDGQNYQDLIAKARELYESGARDFLIDMSDLTYISSAGLVALHTVALLARGEALPDTEAGWPAIRSVGRAGGSGIQERVKLLNPRDDVKSVLDMVGFSKAFDIFSDFDEAVKSF